MLALVMDGGPRLDKAYPKPRPRAGESLVRVRLAGICGTDLELTHGYMNFSGVPGHEFVGEVVKTADARLRGRRVVGEINAACGHCDECIRGLDRHCSNRTVLGILSRDGAFADFLTLPDHNLHPVSESLDDERAVFIEPIAAAYEILEQVAISHTASIAVLGDGRLGAIVQMVLSAEGYLPVLGGHHEEKLSRLSDLGLDARREQELAAGFDVVVECTGRSQGIKQALELVRPRGTIVLKSTVATDFAFNLSSAVVNEVTIVGSRCGRFTPAIAALETHKLDPHPLISAILPLEQGLEGFAMAAEPASFKVLLKPG